MRVLHVAESIGINSGGVGVVVEHLHKGLDEKGIEYRRGSAGGGNQLRQPYLKSIMPDKHWEKFPNTEHVHFYGFYVGNYPSLTQGDIINLTHELNLH